MSKPIISVIIPVFNEKKTIKEIIRRVQKLKIKKEIIIVDDFSTDGTREIIKKLKSKNTKMIFLNRNHGKGYAIREGLKYTKGKIIIIQDADLEYNPKDYYKLIAPLISKKSKIVYGTRFPKGRKIKGISPIFLLGNKILTFTANLLYSTNITDEATCYKVFDFRLIKSLNLKSKRFEFCPEVTAKLRKKGYKILEVPISYNPRAKKEGKKIKWKDGFNAIYTLIKYRFTD